MKQRTVRLLLYLLVCSIAVTCCMMVPEAPRPKTSCKKLFPKIQNDASRIKGMLEPLGKYFLMFVSYRMQTNNEFLCLHFEQEIHMFGRHFVVIVFIRMSRLDKSQKNRTMGIILKQILVQK